MTNEPTAPLRKKIGEALTSAMRDRDAPRLSTLRLVTSALKDRDIAARGTSGATEAEDADVVALLAKMVKQRLESIRAYDAGGRPDLAAQERAEIEVINEFLPRQLEPAEVDAAIEAAVAETGAQTLRDMGKVMALLRERFAGRIDFGAVGPAIKARLA